MATRGRSASARGNCCVVGLRPSGMSDFGESRSTTSEVLNVRTAPIPAVRGASRTVLTAGDNSSSEGRGQSVGKALVKESQYLWHEPRVRSVAIHPVVVGAQLYAHYVDGQAAAIDIDEMAFSVCKPNRFG